MTNENVTLPLLPLKSGVVLPGMVFTMALESDEARAAVDSARSAGGRLLLVPHIEGRFAAVGVIAEVMEEGDLPGGLPAVALRGDGRATIGTGVPGTGDALWVEAEPVVEPEPTPAANELAREYRAVLENILHSRGAGRVAAALRDVTEPSRLADMAGYSPDLSLGQKVEVLETIDVERRLRLVLGWARDTLADVTLREKIKTDVEEGMEKTQREFLLRRQLEAIRKELGELSGNGTDADPDDYRTKIAERDLPEHVRTAVEREVDKLERTSDQSPETGWIRSWLDTVLEVPWGTESEDRHDIAEAARILDADHDGLKDVKDRILEHLAVRKLQAERGLAPVDGRGSGAILALVGPPGVGKTSLGESVANALGRKFVRVSLGGVRDEAEIRGHRRTYVGAQAGRLVRALREAGTMNPVIVLDEVDKLGSDYRGDPSSALLEVLDPAQNHTFRDHYLEVDLDLSRVLFIATANITETIPGPLLDRMEVIRLDGYTENEKVSIAKHHLIGRQLARAALRPDEVEISDEAIRTIVADYTREAGVRNLEREIGRLLRKAATALTSGERSAPVVVDGPDVRGWLGSGALLLRGGGPHQRARRGHRPGRDRRRRRRALRRSQRVRRARGSHPHRPTGRRDEGVGGDRAVLRALARGGARDRPGRLRRAALPRARARGRRAQGRPVGRCHHDDGTGQPVARHPGAAGGRHDRRGDAPGPRAAHRRGQAEGAGGAPGRTDRGRPARAQRSRSRGRARGGARGHDVPPGRHHRRRARPRSVLRRPSRSRRHHRRGRAGRGGLSAGRLSPRDL